jgi:hypothetical protein
MVPGQRAADWLAIQEVEEHVGGAHRPEAVCMQAAKNNNIVLGEQEQIAGSPIDAPFQGTKCG